MKCLGDYFNAKTACVILLLRTKENRRYWKSWNPRYWTNKEKEIPQQSTFGMSQLSIALLRVSLKCISKFQREKKKTTKKPTKTHNVKKKIQLPRYQCPKTREEMIVLQPPPASSANWWTCSTPRDAEQALRSAPQEAPTHPTATALQLCVITQTLHLFNHNLKNAFISLLPSAFVEFCGLWRLYPHSVKNRA